MFAGEGTPERTNRRFHSFSVGQPAARLSTAFDSVTLYGEDPAPRPDIYGKIGNPASTCPRSTTLRRSCIPASTCARRPPSVSMTINGPAPIILAMFMNTAIDQQVEKYLEGRSGSRWAVAEQKIAKIFEGRRASSRTTANCRPETTASASACSASPATSWSMPRPTNASGRTLATVRGTVQPTSSRRGRAQNTCIFSTEFALRMMGDIQQYFVDRKVRNFYSVSISGYHIAEAGANPISQLRSPFERLHPSSSTTSRAG